MSNYNEAGLERLYQAIRAQAEQDFLQAVDRNYPFISSEHRARMLQKYHQLEERAEARMITQQSRGKQE